MTLLWIRVILFFFVWTVPFAVMGAVFQTNGYFEAMQDEWNCITYGYKMFGREVFEGEEFAEMYRKARRGRAVFVGLLLTGLVVSMITALAP